MCDPEADIAPALRDSLDSWAKDNNCGCVDLEKDTEFKRIWLFCITCAAFVCLSVTLAMLWSDKRKDTDLEDLEADATKTQKRRKSAADVEEELHAAAPDYGPEPDLAKARLHLHRTSPTKNGQWRPVLGTHLSEFSEIGGVGTELYFRFLKRLGGTYLYMAALTCVTLAFNTVSSFAPDNGQYLSKTTLGNIGSNVAATSVPPDQRYLVLLGRSGCEGTPVTRMTNIIAWLDFASIVVFVVSVVLFRFHVVPKIEKEADEDDTTVSDFSVEIDKLPTMFVGMQDIDDGVNKYEAELTTLLESRMEALRKAHPDPLLDKTGPPKVRELVLVRDFSGRLTAIRDKAELMQDIDIHRYCGHDKKVEKHQKTLDKLSAQIDQKLAPKEELPVVRAFAILNTQQDRRNLQMDYRFSTYTLLRLLQGGVGRWGVFEGCCPVRKRFFRGHNIRVREPPEPTNIIWENQDVPYKVRLIRRTVISLIFFVIVLISFALVYSANAGAKANMKSNNQLLGDGTCDPVTSNMAVEAGQAEPYKCYVATAANWTMEYLETEATDDDRNCWCGTRGYQHIVDTPRLITGMCSPWLKDVGTGIAIGAAATLIVVVINVVCKTVLVYLAEQEKPLSETELNRSKMVKIWALQTLNTGFVIFCVNFSPPPGMPFGFIFLGEYSDAVRGWYSVVGAAVLMNMLANAVTPGTTSLAWMLINKVMRWRGSRPGQCKHHTQLLRLHENPPFDIAAKFAQLLTTVFVTMSYSAGMPLLNIFAAFYMFYTYWSDKFSLLWGSKRPPAIDTRMARDASQYMLYAVGLHCFFAIWMFGQPCTFPSKPLGGQLSSLSDQAIDQASSSSDYAGAAEQNGFADRVALESTWMMFLLLVVLVALWVIWTLLWFLGGTVGEFVSCLWMCLCHKRKASVVAPGCSGAAAELRNLDQWDYAKVAISNICPPASYAMKHHPSFRHVQAEFDKTLRSSLSSVQSPMPASGPPVDPDLAEGFLRALRSEYVTQSEGAVGKFFETSAVCDADQEVLSNFEELVRGAAADGVEEASKAILAVAQKWQLPPPS